MVNKHQNVGTHNSHSFAKTLNHVIINIDELDLVVLVLNMVLHFHREIVNFTKYPVLLFFLLVKYFSMVHFLTFFVYLLVKIDLQ